MGKPDARAYYLFGFRVIGDFGATIALPAVAAAWIGSKLDARWGTKPFLLIGCLALAAALTAISVRRKALAYGKEYQALIDAAHDSDRDSV